MKTTILPPTTDIIADLGGLFVPQDTQDDEIRIRQGRIRTNSTGSIVDVILAHTTDNSEVGWSMLALTREVGEPWEISIGAEYSWLVDALEPLTGQRTY